MNLIVDAHFHTNVYAQWDGLLEESLELLEKNNILVFSQSCDIEGYETTLEIAKKSNYVVPCFGIHPQVAHEFTDKLETLEDYFEQAIAFGEIGLDHSYLKDKNQYPHQYQILERFFEYAQKNNTLVILHLDGAEEKALEMIQNFSLKKVIVHCYKGTIPTLNKMANYGCYFSVGGNYILDSFKPVIGEKDWNHLQRVIKEVPEELLLLETDGPSRVTPEAKSDDPRGKPTRIFKSIRKIAEIRNITEEDFLALTRKNILKLLAEDERLKKYIQKMKNSH